MHPLYTIQQYLLHYKMGLCAFSLRSLRRASASSPEATCPSPIIFSSFSYFQVQYRYPFPPIPNCSIILLVLNNSCWSHRGQFDWSVHSPWELSAGSPSWPQAEGPANPGVERHLILPQIQVLCTPTNICGKCRTSITKQLFNCHSSRSSLCVPIPYFF